MRTRLNKDMRRYLIRLADHTVKAPGEEAAWEAAYKVAEKEVLRCLLKTFPKRDMDVLEKYDLCVRSHFINVAVPGEHVRFENFALHGDKWEKGGDSRACPRVPSGGYNKTRVILDAVAGKAYNAAADALAARTKAREELLNSFHKVCINAKCLEDIEAVWPAAKEVRRLAPQVPQIMLGDALAAMAHAVEHKLA